MPCRLAIVAHAQEELVQRLEQWMLEQRNTKYCYFSVKAYYTGNNTTPIGETGDIHSELAKLWVAGNSVSWNDLYKGKRVDRIAGLPTYPFKRRTCWIDRHQDVGEAVGTVPCASPPPLASPALFPSPVFPRRTEALTFAPMVTFPSRQDHENKVVEFYTLEVERSKEGFQTEYLTFCPFEEKVPGFSMSRVFLYPEKYPDEQRLMQEKQTEMRQVLFCREDFQAMRGHLRPKIFAAFACRVLRFPWLPSQPVRRDAMLELRPRPLRRDRARSRARCRRCHQRRRQLCRINLKDRRPLFLSELRNRSAIKTRFAPPKTEILDVCGSQPSPIRCRWLL